MRKLTATSVVYNTKTLFYFVKFNDLISIFKVERNIEPFYAVAIMMSKILLLTLVRPLYNVNKRWTITCSTKRDIQILKADWSSQINVVDLLCLPHR